MLALTYCMQQIRIIDFVEKVMAALNKFVPPNIAGMSNVQNLSVLQNQQVTLECKSDAVPPPVLTWLKDGEILEVHSLRHLIVKAQVSDAGMYTCVASNRAGIDNKHYSLQVYVPPSIENGGETEVTVLKGNPISLVCLANGIPTPTISWLKDGQTFSVNLRATFENQKGGLHISNSEINDSGRYTCIASNEAGEDNQHFTLKVLEPPHINKSDNPEEISTVINNPLELLCISDGIPIPKLTWMKDGRPLPQTDTIRVLRGGQIFRISSAQVEDTGRYTCLASSPAGDDDKEYLVRVHAYCPPLSILGLKKIQLFTTFTSTASTVSSLTV
ncbi:PREDICTED: hemicentin-1-like [Thamnophis sirtalis]|uniref:Hemicentin-1-like n=1 Tax=Thamnophis sirtalis TaxID=35019 RepID=A0A6I9YGH5_9SAUR|nr:PREDICTED: hemicentin-1-like [Thamnophis sirtalis]